MSESESSPTDDHPTRDDPTRGDPPDGEPTEMDYAAWTLVAEAINTGSVISGLFRSILADIPDSVLDGEEPEAVVLEMMVGSALPSLRKVGPDQCRKAADLLRSIHDRVMDDLRLATEIADRRS